MDWLDFVSEQWLLVSLLLVLVTAFIILESRKGGASISFHEATRLINGGQAVVVDVREAKDYKAGHIVDSVNVPYTAINERYKQLNKHQNKQLIVVDKMGQHAGAAGKILRDKGFNTVRLQGGIAEWSQQNLPLVKA